MTILAATCGSFRPNHAICQRRSQLTCRGSSQDGQQNSGMSEELIARLKAAEEEAQRLKKELAVAKAAAATADAGEDAALEGATPRPPAVSRIDGGDLRRETLAFVETKPRNWLSESDVEFFTGGGPGESSSESLKMTKEENAVIQRRLLIGIGLTAVVGAFALVPTERLQPPPSKPLFFYLVPLLRVQRLLEEAEKIIPEGDYMSLKAVLARIEGAPNNVQQNLRSAAASLSDSRQAEAADYVARDVYEYLKGIDYQTYYESVGGGPGGMARGGSGQAELFEYSMRSAGAARRKLQEFLALMPAEQLEAAEQQVATSPF